MNEEGFSIVKVMGTILSGGLILGLMNWFNNKINRVEDRLEESKVSKAEFDQYEKGIETEFAYVNNNIKDVKKVLMRIDDRMDDKQDKP
jgi:hypothetical protein